MSQTKEVYAEIAVSLPWHDKTTSIPERDRAAAFGFYTAACCYCQEHLTDGLIKNAELVRVFPDKRSERLAELLTEAGLFDRTDKGYRVHDWLDHNKSRAEVEALAQARRNAGAAGGQARAKAKRKAPAQANAQASAKANAKQNTSKPEANFNPTITIATTTDNNPSPLTPLPGGGNDEDVPQNVQRYMALQHLWLKTIGSVASENTKRKLRAWAEMGYSEDAVASALATALEQGASSPADYASSVLRNSAARRKPAEDEGYLEAKYGGAAQ